MLQKGQPFASTAASKTAPLLLLHVICFNYTYILVLNFFLHYNFIPGTSAITSAIVRTATSSSFLLKDTSSHWENIFKEQYFRGIIIQNSYESSQ